MAVKTLGGLDRGLIVLETIAARAPISGAALADELGLERSALQRVLTTMSRSGWIRQDAATRKWHPGPTAVTFASSVDTTRPLVELARPHLVALRDQSGETAFLAVAQSGAAVIMDVVESDQLVRISPRVGMTISAELSAAMLAIAAFVPDDERDRLLVGAVDDATIARELARTRRRGCSISEGTVHSTTTSVAAPVKDANGIAVAAVVVTLPRERATRGLVRRLPAMLEESAAALTRAASHSRIATS